MADRGRSLARRFGSVTTARSFLLRQASSADIPALAGTRTPRLLRSLDLGASSGRALSWSGAIALLAEDAEGLAGYVLGRVVVDQAEILSIAAAPRCRRSGIGRRLLDTVLATMVERGAISVWLEVRVSNVAARALYEAAGFVATGLRRDYYRQPLEDALVLRRELMMNRVSET